MQPDCTLGHLVCERQEINNEAHIRLCRSDSPFVLKALGPLRDRTAWVSVWQVKKIGA